MGVPGEAYALPLSSNCTFCDYDLQEDFASREFELIA